MAVPPERPVTNPPWLTETEEELELHDTNLFVAFAGDTVATSCRVAPISIALDLIDNVTPLTATLAPIVTAQDAVKLPSLVVTVIVAEPADTPVTRPFALTVAREVFEEDHTRVLIVAFAGATVAVSCKVFPTFTDEFHLDK